MSKNLMLPALALGVLLLAGVSAEAAAKGPTDAQKQALATCAACHDLTSAKATKMGPPLFGLVGAKPRSPGMPFKKWDKASLGAFLAAPAKVKPGTTMPYSVPDAKQRAAVVEALGALK
jgi:cytochrome c2